MATDNEALIEAILEALDRGDIDAALDRTHEDVEVLTASGMEDVRGRERFREFLQPRIWDRQRHVAEALHSHGDHVFARVRAGGTALISGAHVEQTLFITWTVVDGLVRRVEAHFDPQRYRRDLEAAGLPS